MKSHQSAANRRKFDHWRLQPAHAVAMACSLQARTGWPIHVLVERDADGIHLHHAFVVGPDSKFYDGIGQYDLHADVRRMQCRLDTPSRRLESRALGSAAALTALLPQLAHPGLYAHHEVLQGIAAEELDGQLGALHDWLPTFADLAPAC